MRVATFSRPLLGEGALNTWGSCCRSVLLRVTILLFLACACTCASGSALAAPRDHRRERDGADDRFEPYAFIGEVNNRFASEGRNLLDRRSEDDKSRVDRAVGFGFDYRVWGQDTSARQIVFGGQTVHTARTKVVASDSLASGTNQQDQFLEVLRDGTVFEALASLKIRWPFNWLSTSSGRAAVTAIYLKGQGGLIRSDVGSDDVLDNHFIGFGIEHLAGPYRDSFFELGTGRSELFEHDRRDWRFKAGASLNYTPGVDLSKGTEGGALGLFAEAWLDTDVGPGADDIQLYLGLFFDIEKVLAQYQK